MTQLQNGRKPGTQKGTGSRALAFLFHVSLPAAIALNAFALGVVSALAQGSTLPASRNFPPWTECEQERLSGHVRSVTVWSADVVHGTTQPATERHRVSTIEFSDDGRFATETQYHGIETSVLKYEFDTSGKLTKLVSLLGATPLRTTECQYDVLGRLSSSSSRARDGGGESRYTYADRLLTVRMVHSHAKTTVLTYEFDSSDRLVQATERDEATGARLSRSRYEYKDGGRSTCDVSTVPERCAFERIDDQGHVIERIFPGGRAGKHTFDYDHMSNWVTHVSESGAARDQAVWRDITYK